MSNSSISIDQFAQADAFLKSASESQFIKLQPGQSMVLEFKSFEPVEREFNGKKTKRMLYTVVTPNGEEKKIEFSAGWAGTIQAILKKGRSKIEITREGEGLKTQYTFIAV